MQIKKLSALLLTPLFLGVVTQASAGTLPAKQVPLIKFSVSKDIDDKTITNIGDTYAAYGKAAKENTTRLTAEKLVKVDMIQKKNGDYLGYFAVDQDLVQVTGTPAEIGKKAFDEISKRM